ncbi:hypothetical protein KGA66_16375 [Actinocrinis puniceicyclus]|uniref:RedV protein n=1 Tax=Actinocrinis puniceicyclus TaxID=977794 RepID=A0A8J7WR46_9ACTN|nr:hypothetical protein [Actinocrinis puniceicyclus]MBS2964634.1 hypothetical protein [Actinocrinis puniceicyclus]
MPFPDALREATRIAALSPSSHNCQPWALAHLAGPQARRAAARVLREESAAGEQRYLALALDRDRQLSALPAHRLEMLLSCGLYGQLLVRALAAQGWILAQDTFLPPHEPGGDAHDASPLHPDWPRHWTALSVLKFVPDSLPGAPGRGNTSESVAELRATAQARRTNRAPYRREPLERTVLAALAGTGTGTGTALSTGAGVHVRHLSSPWERKRFAGLIRRHGGRDFSDLDAWRETHSYIRSAQQSAELGDGFTFAQLFGPLPPPRRRLMQFALAPGTMRTLRHLGYPRLLAGQLAAIAEATPTISVLTLPSDRPTAAQVLRAGAYLTDYWLSATRADLVLHPLSILIQHDDAREGLEAAFALPGRAFFAARLGRPTADFPRTARRESSAGHREL